MTIVELIERHGMDIYHRARNKQGNVRAKNGCCYPAATLAAHLLAEHGYTGNVIGPSHVFIDNQTMQQISAEFGEIDPADAATIRRYKLAQTLRGGYGLKVREHYWLETGGYLVDCSLPDASRPQKGIILRPLVAPLAEDGTYQMNGCTLMYACTRQQEQK